MSQRHAPVCRQLQQEAAQALGKPEGTILTDRQRMLVNMDQMKALQIACDGGELPWNNTKLKIRFFPDKAEVGTVTAVFRHLAANVVESDAKRVSIQRGDQPAVLGFLQAPQEKFDLFLAFVEMYEEYSFPNFGRALNPKTGATEVRTFRQSLSLVLDVLDAH